jgi:hypothetical protein
MNPAAADVYIANQQLAGVSLFQTQLARPGPRSMREWDRTSDVPVRAGMIWLP